MIPKFRAWHKTQEEMHGVKQIIFDRENVFDILLDYEDFVVHEDIDNIILMQSTGFFDKNGKEIFEGDIFGTKKDGLLNGIIEYREDFGMWTNSLIRYNNFERLCNVASSREVIGNVYENPKLLEADHDRD